MTPGTPSFDVLSFRICFAPRHSAGLFEHVLGQEHILHLTFKLLWTSLNMFEPVESRPVLGWSGLAMCRLQHRPGLSHQLELLGKCCAQALVGSGKANQHVRPAGFCALHLHELLLRFFWAWFPTPTLCLLEYLRGCSLWNWPPVSLLTFACQVYVGYYCNVQNDRSVPTG